MAKIELHSKLFLHITEERTEKLIARARSIKQGKPEYNLEKELSIKNTLVGIYTNKGIIVGSRYTVDLIELLNGYVSKILEQEHEYEYEMQSDNGFTIKISPATTKQSEALKLTILKTNEIIYLKKIDCKIIVSKFYRAYSKCVDIGFVLTD